MKEKTLGDFQTVREMGEGTDVLVYFRSGGIVRRVKGAIVKVYECPQQPSNQVVYLRTIQEPRLMSIGGGTLARPIKVT